MTYVRELRALTGPRPLILAGASVLVLNDDGEVLLQRRTDNGNWGTPGGLLELGESLEDAARRELHEETTLTARALDLLYVASGPWTRVHLPNGDAFEQVTAVYVTRQWTGEPTPDGQEGAALRWFPPGAHPDRVGPVDRESLARLRELLSGAD